MSTSSRTTALELAEIYEVDETAWLEMSSHLLRAGRVEELDLANLAEYLESMAISDRRQVENRLATLIAHLLKWEHQQDRRSGSWRATVLTQRQQLDRLFKSKTLRNHAEEVLQEVFQDAVKVAAAETGKSESEFSQECPFTLDQILNEPLFQ